MKKMKNLKVRKSLIALLLGVNILTLSKEVKAEELNSEIVVETEETKTFVFQEEVRENKNSPFKTTDIYYLTHGEVPEDSENIRFVFLGELNLDTYDNIVMNRIADNYIDATNRKFIKRDRIIDSCFNDFHFEKYNDDVDMVVSSDGTCLGYTHEFKILTYR